MPSKETCVYCQKEINLEDNEYEVIEGKFYCSECVEEYFDQCEWCKEYVLNETLAWYGNILCCDDCAENDWRRMEEAHNWR